MKSIGATKFKEQCLSLLDRLGPEGILITKHGKPVARLVPFGHDSRQLIGSLKGRIVVRGDLLSTGVRRSSGRFRACTSGPWTWR